MRLCVVVVSYNTRDHLRRCLAGVLATAPPNTDVVVVDNASRDGSAEMVAAEFPSVRLIVSPRNLGFGAANNRALDACPADLALLLNSDAVPRDGAIERLVRAMEDPRVVACGGRLVDPGSDRVQDSCAGPLTLWSVFCEQTLLEKAFPGSRVLSPYWQTRQALQTSTTRPYEVDQVQGACLMMRPRERFDERFFLYVEDTELCRRLRAHGKILYVPDAVFEHALGASSEGSRWEAVALYNRGKELYFLIHEGSVAMATCLAMNRLGAVSRLLGWFAVACATLFGLVGARGALGKCGLFWRVFTAPLRGPRTPPGA